jgi:alanine racemase
MAQLASDYGIEHAVVRDHREAKAIEPLFSTILILGGDAFPSESFSYAINSLEAIERIPGGCRVELKVDTGMHRNGIAPDETEATLKRIEARGLQLVGLMTHFRSADCLSSELFWQQKRFAEIRRSVEKAGYRNLRIHSHNSAAILRATRFDEDLVRVGIAAYGYNELPPVYDEIVLKPVLSLHARRVASRTLEAGERIGYGGSFTAPTAMQVSTYDLGYGDGWPRGESDTPYHTPDGLPLLGRVSMDFIALESDSPELCIMDDAQKAARHFGTISYEMTTALSPNIERTVV